MRLAATAIAASVLLAAPGTARANPVTAGITAGVLHDKVDPDKEGNQTLGLFGRVGLTPRLSGQLEVAKVEDNGEYYEPTTTRTATLLAVFDLVDARRGSRLIPTIAFGAGIDRADTDYMTTEGTHFEGGFGLEYRAEGGFTIGIDLRLGGRSVDNQDVYYATDDTRAGDGAPELCGPEAGCSYPTEQTGPLREGEYRALRVSAGIRF